MVRQSGKNRLYLKSALLVMGVAISLTCFPPSSFAQGVQNVSVVHLLVQPDSAGGQLVVTPKGLLVPLPGAGVNAGMVDIYMGANGGYWYIDKTGKTVDLTSYVKQVRAQTAQLQQATVPQYAPSPVSYNEQQPYQQQQYQQQQQQQGQQSYQQEQQSSSGSSSSGTALGTAAAATVGAMAGSAMSHYNNVPYGTPMYYNHYGQPYYQNREGKEVFVDDGEVQWNNVAKANQAQNYKQTQQINQAKAGQDQRQTERDTQQQQRQTERDTQQQQRQTAYQPNPDARQNGKRQSYEQQGQRFSQQQQWYQDQSRDKQRSQQWQQESRGDNPFVREDSSRERGSREARGGGEQPRARGGAERAGRGGGDRAGRGGGDRAGRGGGGSRGGGGRRGR